MLTKEQRINNLKKANEESHLYLKNALKNTLYELLKENKIENITVTNLVNKAQVSRSSFYKHYDNVKDVIIEDINNIYNDITSSLSNNLDTNWSLILDSTYKNKDKIKLLFDSGLGGEIYYVINSQLKDIQDVNEYYYVSLWNGIIFQTLISWSLHDFKDSIEYLTELIKNYTKPIYNYKHNK